MNMHTARESALKLTYEKCVSGEYNLDTLDDIFENRSDRDDAFIKGIIEGVTTHEPFLRATISKYAIGFNIDRIFKTDLAILYIAVYEVLFSDTPDVVAVNEAVELAKQYSSEKSPSYINGILATVISEKEKILNECNSNIGEANG